MHVTYGESGVGGCNGGRKRCILIAQYSKNKQKMHFFAKIFGHIKKKQYLCTRF